MSFVNICTRYVQYVDMDFKALFFVKLCCELIWTSVFHQALDTEAQSLVFVKRMVVIAVSSITYLRGIFPEDSYRSRYLEGININTGLLKYLIQSVCSSMNVVLQICVSKSSNRIALALEPANSSNGNMLHILYLYNELRCLFIWMYTYVKVYL